MANLGTNHAPEHARTPMTTPWQPYREDRTIRSADRTSLTSAFSHYMALRSGISPDGIARAFDTVGEAEDRDMIVRELNFLAGLFVDGRIQTYARAFGGGEPFPLPAATWEIDDPLPRFADGSLDPARPHDPGAAPTHWILVDNAAWDAAMEGLRDSCLRDVALWSDDAIEGDQTGSNWPAIVVERAAPAGETRLGASAGLPDEPWRSEIMTIETITDATGLARSTIYAKVAAGTFPKQISIHGSRKGWRRGAVHDWLEALPASG